MAEGPVPRILAAQQADGHWEGPERFCAAKYRGTVWSLLILAELGADGRNARVRAACEAVLRGHGRTRTQAAPLASAARRSAAASTLASFPA
jgi:hypothetical protein